MMIWEREYRDRTRERRWFAWRPVYATGAPGKPSGWVWLEFVIRWGVLYRRIAYP